MNKRQSIDINAKMPEQFDKESEETTANLIQKANAYTLETDEKNTKPQ